MVLEGYSTGIGRVLGGYLKGIRNCIRWVLEGYLKWHSMGTGIIVEGCQTGTRGGY